MLNVATVANRKSIKLFLFYSSQYEADGNPVCEAEEKYCLEVIERKRRKDQLSNKSYSVCTFRNTYPEFV